jgi:hypothetical protein
LSGEKVFSPDAPSNRLLAGRSLAGRFLADRLIS